MPSLKGTRTEQNLKDAFAGESQANRRYLCFARKADVEGFKDLAAVSARLPSCAPLPKSTGATTHKRSSWPTSWRRGPR